MRLISVNTGKAEPIDTKSGSTGIFKTPQAGPVQITTLGLARDTIVDTDNHGGVDQAVYIYFQPDYDWWVEELAQPLDPGTFGENLTISGRSSPDILIGDRFAIGDVLLEITSPRIPCVTFARRMGDPKWVRRFMAARRPGVYARVLSEGAVSAGDKVEHVRFTGVELPANDMLVDAHLTPDEMRRRLKTPLHFKARADYEERLKGR